MVYKFGISGFWTGLFTANGGGTTFNIPHGLDPQPNHAWTHAESVDAAGDRYVSSITSTNIVVVYTSATSSGTDNVVIRWFAGNDHSIRDEIFSVNSDSIPDE